MEKKKQYEAIYAGYVFEKLVNHWTSQEEVKHRLTEVDLTKPGTIKAGGMPIISDGRRAYIDAGDSHTAVIACSGMKKSICGFMPLEIMLARAGENMVLTDPKGELFHRTSGFLKSLGYKVLCLDFRTMDKDCFNILSYAASTYRTEDKDKGLSQLSDIVNVLADKQKRFAKDPFWPDTGEMWLNGTGAVMLDGFPRFSQVNVMNWADFNVRSSADMINEALLPLMPDNMAKSALKQCLSSADNTFRSILITASSFLSPFNQNPKLAEMLSYSTFTLEDLVKPKTALFLVTDDTTSTADMILGIIISQIQSFLVSRAYHRKDGKLETRVNFVLDEFASLPIPNMDKALATHRSRNIRYYLCIQSLALLKERYENPEKLLANCESTLFLGSCELELLSELETKLGTTHITPDGSEKPLCSQAELMTLEKTWDYKEAIYMNLSKGIRYCTMLPSIEHYEIGDDPVPSCVRRHRSIATYTVKQFITDIINKRIRAPFASGKNSGKLVPVDETMVISNSKRDRYARRHRAYVENDVSAEMVADELKKQFEELFGTCEDD